MQIVQVSTHLGRRFIPLKGWESVTNALSTYADGYTKGAKGAENVVIHDIGKSHGSNGGMAIGMFLLGGASIPSRSKLVDNLLAEAKESLRKRTEFSKSYDYDGMGTSFFKTSVDIRVLDRDQDMYGIGINAAYVGDEPERGLADHLGIPRTLLSCSVEVETKPASGNCFEFDFEPVVRKIDAVLDTKQITGEQVAAAMLVKDEDIPAFVLQNKEGFEVRIQPGRVESRMKYSRDAGPKDTWVVKGSVFAGELQRDYGNDDQSAKATPTFLLVISSSRKDGWRGSLPIWQPDQQQKAVDLADKIAAALR